MKRHSQHNAREGIARLEDAILEVLASGECLGPAEISRRAGIYRGSGSWKNMITQVVLQKLHDAGRVARCVQINSRPGWRLAAVKSSS